jgi:hypothetical protein
MASLPPSRRGWPHYISSISPRALQARLARLREARLVVLPVNLGLGLGLGLVRVRVKR